STESTGSNMRLAMLVRYSIYGPRREHTPLVRMLPRVDYRFWQGKASVSATVTGTAAGRSGAADAATRRMTVTRICSRVAGPGQDRELGSATASTMPMMYAVHADDPAAEPSEHQLNNSLAKTECSLVSSACAGVAATKV